MEAVCGVPYLSFDAARKAIDDAARDDGIAFIIRKKEPTRTPLFTKALLACSQSRTYKSKASTAPADPTVKRRKTRSKREDCPVRYWVKRNSSGLWSITPGQTTEHSHGPAEPIAIPKYRRDLVIQLKPRIIQMHLAQMRPLQILETFQAEFAQDPANKGQLLITRSDVRNVIQNHRAEKKQPPIN